MGFEVVRDDTHGNEPWIEVKPPQQEPLLVLSPRQPDEPRRTVPDRLPWVNPTIQGPGERPFPGGGPIDLEFLGSRNFDSDVTLLHYQPYVTRRNT